MFVDDFPASRRDKIKNDYFIKKLEDFAYPLLDFLHFNVSVYGERTRCFSCFRLFFFPAKKDKIKKYFRVLAPHLKKKNLPYLDAPEYSERTGAEDRVFDDGRYILVASLDQRH